MNNGSATVMMMAYKKKKDDENRQALLLHDIRNRAVKEAVILFKDETRDTAEMNLLRDIPGVKYADLNAVSGKIQQLAASCGSWAPSGIRASYDRAGQKIRLEKKSVTK